ncbi:helix-turn-helix domain-containing protein [Chromobacterium vaccinii]|uniref:helix-turn-helix domain-containing protein n=1 Tax=Chromobacterium vaccinii TaxID=1108595 RepID=UPI0031CF1868
MSAYLKKIQEAWEVFAKETQIGPIRDEQHYESMLSKLDELWTSINGDENHPLCELAELMSELVHCYETEHHAVPEASGVDALRFLMEEHGLCQGDLPEIGSQGVVSEILNGHRELNLRQVKNLAERFGVSTDTFIS